MSAVSLSSLGSPLKANTNWAVFEPNDEVLWVRVKRTIDVFLTGMWRGGSLAGSVPSEAFFVNIGRDTMSQDDIDNGRLVCVIGVAPVKPAEFVIFQDFSENEVIQALPSNWRRDKTWQDIRMGNLTIK